MNWETYSRMSKKKQDEYNFFFGMPPKTNAVLLTMLITMLVSMIVVQTYTTYLIMSDDRFSSMENMVFDLLQNSMRLTIVGMLIAVTYVLLDAIRIIIFSIKRMKWMKANKIKEIPSWTKWLKRVY